MALPAVESFIGGAGPLADPPWTSPSANTLQLDGSGNCDVVASGDNELAIWNADVFPDDQYSKATIHLAATPGVSDYVVVCVRSDTLDWSVGTRYYAYTDCNSTVGLRKWIAGVDTGLIDVTAGPIVDGDVLELDSVGTAVTVLLNGTQVISVTDSDITSGSAGIVMAIASGPGVVKLSGWEGGELTAGPPPGTHVVMGRGSVAIDSPAWLSTAIEGRPAHLGNGPAEPVNFLHMGSLSWGTANGVMNRYIVTRDLDLVEVPVGMTELHYEFADGITATIVELEAP